MRRLGVLVGLLALPRGSVAAQHAGQFEVGAFGSYARYDAAFGLANKVGGGARLGYFLGNVVGLEGDVLFQPGYTFSTGSTTATMQPLIGSASLVANVVRGPRVVLYVLGGYSLLDFGTRAPYDFTDHAAHGGAGARIFLTDRVALRLEGRGIYTPRTSAASSSGTATHVVATAGLSVLHLGRPPKVADVADKAGVPDRVVACPNPPLGATLDPRGCPLDSDADGVPDGVDKCPTTPAGAVVDAVGCPVDADNDGVPDGIDQCPGTPSGALVDPKGCPMDTDLDRVPDGLDRCPYTPAGTPVDATGCAVVSDSDRDGVPNNLDRCPNTPPGVHVDANGCLVLFQPDVVSRPAPGAPPRPTLILLGVNFESSRSALRPESYGVLDQVAASLMANPDIRIEIAGYTDSTGSAALNLRLSQARAAAVRAYLARDGVPLGRMRARGYGASGYIAPNTTPAGRAQNRRVELHKLP